jgi:uncharacterized protein
MKNKLLLILALFYTGIVFSQNTFLYEISHPKQKHISYLFGTIHVQNPEVFSFNDSVLIAIENTKNAVFELDMTSKEAMKELPSLFKDDKYVKFIDHIQDYIKNDLLPKLVDSIPPSQLAIIIQDNLYGEIEKLLAKKNTFNFNQNFIDVHLQQYAQKNDKNVIALETFKEQMDAMLGDIIKLDLYKQKVSESIISALKNEKNLNLDVQKYMGKSDSMVYFYSQFRMDKIDEMVYDMSQSKNDLELKIYKKMFWDRNQLMFKRSQKLVKKEPTFIAVGAGHLTGKNGLINLYKNAGYTVRPVQTNSKYKREINWKTLETQHYTVSIPTQITLDTVINEETYFGNIDFWLNNDNNTKDKLYLSNGMCEFKIYYHKYEEDIEYGDEYATMAEEDYDETDYDETEETYIDTNTVAIDLDELDIEDAEEVEIEEIQPKQSNPISRLMSGLGGEKYTLYFTEVADSLKGFFQTKKLTMETLISNVDFKEDSIKLTTDLGKEIEIIYSKNILSNTKTYTYQKENGDRIEFIINGDRALIESEEIDRFFKSINIR